MFCMKLISFINTVSIRVYIIDTILSINEAHTESPSIDNNE
jgi:hypothetical protein